MSTFGPPTEMVTSIWQISPQALEELALWFEQRGWRIPISQIIGSDAASISNTPAGGVSATTVQAAINELDAEKQPLDSDLTAVAALVPSNDDVVQRKAGAWTNRTIANLLVDLAAPGTTFQPLDSDLTSIAALATTSYGRGILTASTQADLPVTYGDYTPTWASSGTQPDIGDSTVVARFARVGELVHAWGSIRFGAGTTTFGTGDYYFELPVNAAANGVNRAHIGTAMLNDNGSSLYGTSLVSLQSASLMRIVYGATYFGAETVVGATSPWTWVGFDVITWNIVYEAA